MHAMVRSGTRPIGPRTPVAVALALAAGLAAALAVTVALAPPAAAHATVTSSDPPDQAHLATPPHTVTVRFSEQVNPSVGGLKVINQQRREVQVMSHQTAGDTLMAMLPDDLPAGTYVANYKIISEDGHPINGSIRFAVGDAALADTSALAETTDPKLDALTKFGQFLTYLGALLTGGLAFFLAFLYEPGPERGRLAAIARIAAAVAAVGMVVVLLSQAALATGGGLGAFFSGSTASTVLQQGLGLQTAGVLAGLVLCLVSLSVPRGVPAQSCALWGGLAATASFAFWGHALEGDQSWLKVPADAVHLVAAGLWFGGLAGLAAVLRTRATAAVAVAGAPVAARADEAAGAVPTEAAPVTDAGAVAAPVAAAEREPAGAVAAGPSPRASVTLDDAPAAPSADDVVVVPDPAPADPAEPAGDAVLAEPAPGDGDTVVVVGRDGPGTGGPADALASAVRIVRRFSAAAFVSLLALTAAGVALGLTQAGPLGEVLGTTYGRLLLAKVAVVAVVAAVAGYNRFFLLPWLLHDRAGDADGDAPDEAKVRAGWRTLLRTVLFEAGAIVAVLAVTAVLVNSTPGAPASAAPTGPFDQTQPMKGGQGKVALMVMPNQPGTNSLHVDITGADGRPRDVRDVQVELTQEETGIAFTRTAVHGGPGHYALEGSNDLAVAGTWDIDVVVSLDQFNEERVSFKDEVR